MTHSDSFSPTLLAFVLCLGSLAVPISSVLTEEDSEHLAKKAYKIVSTRETELKKVTNKLKEQKLDRNLWRDWIKACDQLTLAIESNKRAIILGDSKGISKGQGDGLAKVNVSLSVTKDLKKRFNGLATLALKEKDAEKEKTKAFILKLINQFYLPEIENCTAILERRQDRDVHQDKRSAHQKEG